MSGAEGMDKTKMKQYLVPAVGVAAVVVLVGLGVVAYFGGGLHYSFDTDFARVGRILKEAGFRGYVSIEHEGKALPAEAIRRSVDTLRDAFAGL